MFIPVAEPWLDAEEVEQVLKAIKSGWIAKGEQLLQFEKGFAQYLGVKEAVAVSSGTAALEVALRALNPKGNEILTSAASCVATANAILHAGYKPVFVDIDPITYNLDPKQIKTRLSPQTGAMIPVHLYGHPCDMDPIMAISRETGIPVVEDCGQSLGAKYKGQFTGTFGKAACFSLYANKTITTGEGGIIATNDKELAERARLIRNQGQHPEKPFYHILFGYNFKMTNIQAAIGLGQLKKLNRAIERRRENAATLASLLSDIPEIQLPKEMPWAKCAYFCFPILLKDKKLDRDRVCQFLKEKGIETRPMFGPISEQPYFIELFGHGEQFPLAKEVGDRGFYVSCSPTLNKSHLDYLALNIRKALGSCR
jgi:perosamine synthetase